MFTYFLCIVFQILADDLSLLWTKMDLEQAGVIRWTFLVLTLKYGYDFSHKVYKFCKIPVSLMYSHYETLDNEENH